MQTAIVEQTEPSIGEAIKEDPIKIIVKCCRPYQRLMQAEKPIENQIRAMFLSHYSAQGHELKDGKPLAKKAMADLTRLVKQADKTMYAEINERTGRPKRYNPTLFPSVASIDELLMISRDNALDPTVTILEAHRLSLERYRMSWQKRIEAAVRELPIWPWAESIRGVAELNIGLIVGACGGPLYPNYETFYRVWKRMGLAVMANGERQRKIVGRTKELKAMAIEAGYSPSRRAIMHIVGESLVKLNREGKEDDGNLVLYRYGAIYVNRKKWEAGMKPGDCKAAWHARAMRYMEKRFLKYMWKEWKRVEIG